MMGLIKRETTLKGLGFEGKILSIEPGKVALVVRDKESKLYVMSVYNVGNNEPYNSTIFEMRKDATEFLYSLYASLGLKQDKLRYPLSLQDEVDEYFKLLDR